MKSSVKPSLFKPSMSRKLKKLSTAKTRFVKNIKKLILKEGNAAIFDYKKKAKSKVNINESNFIKVLRKLIIEKMDKSEIINFFEKSTKSRTFYQIKLFADFLSLNQGMQFFWNLREIDKDSLLYIINYLHLEKFKKNDVIFNYHENLSKFYVILKGKISLCIPFFKPQLMAVREFIEHLRYLRDTDYMKLYRTEARNLPTFNLIADIKDCKYDIDAVNINLEEERNFFIEEKYVVNELKEGMAVNDLSLIYNFNMNFQGIAEDDLCLGVIDKADFFGILKEKLDEAYQIKFNLIRRFSYVFSNWTTYNIAQISTLFTDEFFIFNDFIYKQGDDSDCFYMVEEGEFECYCELSINKISSFERYVSNQKGNIVQIILDKIKNKNPLIKDEIFSTVKNGEQFYGKFPVCISDNKNFEKLLANDKDINDKLVNLKINEEVFNYKEKIVKIFLFKLKKFQLIGIADSLLAKNRLFTVKCVSKKGALKKIRLNDFLSFYIANSHLCFYDFIKYINKRVKIIVDRLKFNKYNEYSNNKRIFRELIDDAIDNHEKNDIINSKNNNKSTEKNYNTSKNNIQLLKNIFKSNKKIIDIYKTNSKKYHIKLNKNNTFKTPKKPKSQKSKREKYKYVSRLLYDEEKEKLKEKMKMYYSSSQFKHRSPLDVGENELREKPKKYKFFVDKNVNSRVNIFKKICGNKIKINEDYFSKDILDLDYSGMFKRNSNFKHQITSYVDKDDKMNVSNRRIFSARPINYKSKIVYFDFASEAQAFKNKIKTFNNGVNSKFISNLSNSSGRKFTNDYYVTEINDYSYMNCYNKRQSAKNKKYFLNSINSFNVSNSHIKKSIEGYKSHNKLTFNI